MPPRVTPRAFDRSTALLSATVAVVALAVRLVPVLTSAGLFGAPNYDPSVYYAAAVGFFEGRVPYGDFLLLHPPGIVLLLQPFAALGQWMGDPVAFATARVTFMAGGAVSAALVFVLLRPRGRTAAWAGAGLYAVYPAAAHVERATWLEAPASLMLLLALLALRPTGAAVRPWRTAVAGGLLSLAMFTKLWGVVPLAVVFGWVLLARRVRAALAYVLGAAAAATAVLTPFWAVLAPLWTDAVTAQVQRPSVRTAALLRICTLLGMDQASAADAPVLVTLVLAAGALALAVVAVRDVAGRLYVALLATTVAALLAVASWYPNYPAFAAAPIALTLGSSVSVIRASLRPRARSVAAAVVAALVTVGVAAQLGSRDGFTFPGADLSRVLATRPGCVTTDHPISLILTDRLRADLQNGCRLVVDLSGYIHVLPGSDQRRDNPQFQTLMMDYLGGGGTAVVMSGMWPGDFSPDNRETVRGWPVVGTAGTIEVRQPTP